MTEFQTRALNPTKKSVVIRNLISQSQGYSAKKKESKWVQYFVTGNIISYSKILNYDNSLKNSKTTMICLLVW